MKYLHVLAITVVLAGCATGKQASQEASKPTDTVDSIIAKYAADATLQLRRLSENTGASRMQETGPGRPDSASQAMPASNIAGATGSIAVSPGEPSAGGVAQANPSKHPAAKPIPSALAVPPGLEKNITLTWTGDLETLIFLIGKEAGWKVVEPTGLRVSPVIIAINAKDKPIFEVLRDVGAIAGTAADVVVAVEARTLGVAYPKR